MIQLLTKKMRNRKGFTLIELIVVIAILGIIALIAIPRFAGIQERSRENADVSTARQIINTARIIAAENDISDTDLIVEVAFPGAGNDWDYDGDLYMTVPDVQRDGGSDFALSLNADNKLEVVIDGTNTVTVVEGAE